MSTPAPTNFLQAMDSGRAAQAKGDHAAALAAFEAALPLADGDGEVAGALLGAAASLGVLGRHAEAVEQALLVVPLKDLDANTRGWALHALAHALINAGRGGEDGPWWEKLAALDGADPVARCEAHVALGYARLAAGDRSAAREAFDACRAVRGGLDQHQASAALHTARSHVDEGDFAAARAALDAFDGYGGAYPAERKQAAALRKQVEQRLA